MRHVNEGLLSTLSQGQAVERMSAGRHVYNTVPNVNTCTWLAPQQCTPVTTMTCAHPFTLIQTKKQRQESPDQHVWPFWH